MARRPNSPKIVSKDGSPESRLEPVRFTQQAAESFSWWKSLLKWAGGLSLGSVLVGTLAAYYAIEPGILIVVKKPDPPPDFKMPESEAGLQDHIKAAIKTRLRDLENLQKDQGIPLELLRSRPMQHLFRDDDGTNDKVRDVEEQIRSWMNRLAFLQCRLKDNPGRDTLDVDLKYRGPTYDAYIKSAASLKKDFTDRDSVGSKLSAAFLDAAEPDLSLLLRTWRGETKPPLATVAEGLLNRHSIIAALVLVSADPSQENTKKAIDSVDGNAAKELVRAEVEIQAELRRRSFVLMRRNVVRPSESGQFSVPAVKKVWEVDQANNVLEGLKIAERDPRLAAFAKLQEALVYQLAGRWDEAEAGFADSGSRYRVARVYRAIAAAHLGHADPLPEDVKKLHVCATFPSVIGEFRDCEAVYDDSFGHQTTPLVSDYSTQCMGGEHCAPRLER